LDGISYLLRARSKRHQLRSASLYSVDQLGAEPFVHPHSVDLTERALGQKNAAPESKEHRQPDREQYLSFEAAHSGTSRYSLRNSTVRSARQIRRRTIFTVIGPMGSPPDVGRISSLHCFFEIGLNSALTKK